MLGISLQGLLMSNPRISSAINASLPSGSSGDGTSNSAASVGQALIKAAGFPEGQASVVSLSSLGKSLSAGLAQDTDLQSDVYAFDSLGAGAALGKGTKTATLHEGAVADRALVSALMLAITNSNWKDTTSAMALRSSPALSGL
jgi:hypothetical protein